MIYNVFVCQTKYSKPQLTMRSFIANRYWMNHFCWVPCLIPFQFSKRVPSKKIINVGGLQTYLGDRINTYTTAPCPHNFGFCLLLTENLAFVSMVRCGSHNINSWASFPIFVENTHKENPHQTVSLYTSWIFHKSNMNKSIANWYSF